MRRGLPAVAAVLVVALAGCTSTVSLREAPKAESPACAGVIVRLPDAVGQAERRQTDAQGTAAWGDPQAVTLRCGVAQPGPSTECYAIGGVDWIRRDERIGGTAVVVLTTFDRRVATQVVVDPGTDEHVSVSDVLPGVSDAITAAVPQTSTRCTS